MIPELQRSLKRRFISILIITDKTQKRKAHCQHWNVTPSYHLPARAPLQLVIQLRLFLISSRSRSHSRASSSHFQLAFHSLRSLITT
jgi:hypothetical protein